MLRRVLPVAAAAAVVLVPSAAWATPAQAPVDNYRGSSYSGFANDVVLSNGWHANAYLGEGNGTNQRQGWGFLSLEVWDPSQCPEEDGCYAPHSFWSGELTAEQVDFDRGLRTASVQNVPVELPDPTYVPTPADEGPGSGGEDPGTGEVDPGTGEVDPGTGEGGTLPDPDPIDFPQPETIALSVSLTFTGTGPVDRSAGHQTICGDGERLCQSVRVYANRGALARLTLGEWGGDASSAGLSYTQGIDAAEPKLQNVAF